MTSLFDFEDTGEDLRAKLRVLIARYSDRHSEANALMVLTDSATVFRQAHEFTQSIARLLGAAEISNSKLRGASERLLNALPRHSYHVGTDPTRVMIDVDLACTYLAGMIATAPKQKQRAEEDAPVRPFRRLKNPDQ